MKAPGAMTDAPLAALTIPPAPMIGVEVLAATEPVSVNKPTRPVDEPACKLIVAFAAAFCGVQVAAHWPAPSGFNATGESPDENVATTAPLSSVLPQSSKICASKGTGCPTV